MGGLLGAGYAVVYRDANLFSWETLKYALIGAIGGAIIGALLGAAAFAVSGGSAAGLLTTLRVGFQQYVLKWFPAAGQFMLHSRTLVAAGVGFILGFAVGWVYPDLIIGISSAVATAVSFLADITAWHMTLQFYSICFGRPAFHSASIYVCN
jgi:hypothetical protein